VAWVLGTDVWVRVIKPTGDNNHSAAMVASGSERFIRTEVELTASSEQPGRFVVAWSSWLQDGDAWGVFAQPFGADGLAEGQQLQLNFHTHHFQWQPQLAWCDDTVWALWANGTSGASTGPFLRQLSPQTRNTSWELGTELNLEGHLPLAATLSCGKDRGAATVLWLESGGKRILRKQAQPQQRQQQQQQHHQQLGRHCN